MLNCDVTRYCARANEGVDKYSSARLNLHAFPMKRNARFDIARDGRSRFVFSAMSSRMRSHSAVTIENENRVTAAVTIATAFCKSHDKC